MNVLNPMRPSVQNHNFSKVPHADIPRSVFRRPFSHKTTFDSGYLVPIYVDEVLPGDSFNVKMTSLARLATPIVPFMDNLKIDYHFFFVPNRLIWDNFQKFMGEQDNPGDSTDYLVPQIPAPAGGFPVGCICDYMGIPTGITGFSVNNLHGRAYNLIYNEWYRDQNLQDSITVDTDDGPDTPADYVIRKRGKRKDYFTSCLPWPQKGDAVDLPLGTQAPVNYDGADNTIVGVYSTVDSGLRGMDTAGNPGDPVRLALEETAGAGLYADLTDATAATISDLREAFQMQRLLERDARGGTRYTEILLSHFRVTSPDQRLQRPEFLGGGTSNVVINPVPQTSSTDGTTAQGNLAAIGTMINSDIGFTKSFVEHGVIIGIASCRADLTYQQGLNRMWSRRTRYDYYWPSLAHLSEQAVLSKELYLDATSNDDDVFGYIPRWDEYRYKPSLITGKMRSSDPQSLDVWHLSQDFASRPVLNSDFITENPPVDRVIATPTEPEFIMDCYFDIIATRPMPMHSVPGLIDHF